MEPKCQQQPEKQTQLNQQYGEPSFPTQYSASAPAEFPTPPPSYSEFEPPYPQNQQSQLKPNQGTPFIYPQQHHQPNIIQQQPQVQHIVVLQIPLERRPINTTCPSCQAAIVTRVKTEANITTHTAALLLCLFFPLCSCLPYCMTSCQSSVHSCPNCAAYIGSYRPGYYSH